MTGTPSSGHRGMDAVRRRPRLLSFLVGVLIAFVAFAFIGKSLPLSLFLGLAVGVGSLLLLTPNRKRAPAEPPREESAPPDSE